LALDRRLGLLTEKKLTAEKSKKRKAKKKAARLRKPKKWPPVLETKAH
jgi:hypothetical protein